MFVTSDGSPYARFRRALGTGNQLLVLAAARELPRVGLDDALRICLVLRDGDPERYDRACVRWLGRFALEARGATIHDVRRRRRPRLAPAGPGRGDGAPAGALPRARRRVKALGAES